MDHFFNPFLFIRGLFCPCCVEASVSLNCLMQTIPGFPFNCLPVPCGDIDLKKNPRSSIGLEIRPKSAFPGRFCPQQTILLSDLVECNSPLQIEMAVWHFYVKILSAPSCHYC